MSPRPARRAGLSVEGGRAFGREGEGQDRATKPKEGGVADRVSASIKLGGDLPVTLLDDPVRLIEDEDLGPDWDGPFTSEAEIRTYLAGGAAGVTLYANEVSSGEFEALQAFCVDYRLTYVLTYDGSGGPWAPGRRIRRPDDRGDGFTCTLDDSLGFACISADQIRALQLGSIEDVLAHLERFDLSETPPLTIQPAAPIQRTGR